MNYSIQTNLIKTKNKKILVYTNYYEPKKEYLKAKKSTFYYDESYKDKFLIVGQNAIIFINHLLKKTIDHDLISFYDIISFGINNYYEVQFIKLNHDKYLIIANDLSNFVRRFKKIRQHLNLRIYDVTKSYQLYSIFNLNKNDLNIGKLFLVETKYQNYQYHNLILKNNQKSELEQFRQNNIFEVGLETVNIFFYNNNVISFFNNLSRNQKKIVGSCLYDLKLKYQYRIIKLELIEPCVHNQNVYLINKQKIGKVLNTYYLYNKKYPIAICYIKNEIKDKYFFIKEKRSFFISRKINIYQERNNEQFNYNYY